MAYRSMDRQPIEVSPSTSLQWSHRTTTLAVKNHKIARQTSNSYKPSCLIKPESARGSDRSKPQVEVGAVPKLRYASSSSRVGLARPQQMKGI